MKIFQGVEQRIELVKVTAGYRRSLTQRSAVKMDRFENPNAPQIYLKTLNFIYGYLMSLRAFSDIRMILDWKNIWCVIEAVNSLYMLENRKIT